ncbi:amidohydrolase family protein [Flavobacterium hungaricum]|nr:amidohydrolase family protein [Flavobacterium hungaricum]
MKNFFFTSKRLILLLFFLSSNYIAQAQQKLFQDVTILDGTGKPAKEHQDILVLNDKIISISAASAKTPKGITIINLKGKTIMPLIIDTHAHLGLLKDTVMASKNFTKENIAKHLLRFQDYGIGSLLSMGTDHQEIFNFREDSRSGKLAGAAIYTAGIGFGVKDGAPPVSFGMDKVNRPQTPEEASQQVKEIAAFKPDVIKIWVDDFFGKFPKMKPEIYKAIIDEAHKNNIRVSTHLYYLEDARQLVNSGVDIIAHSIRDQEVDESLLALMKKNKVTYIPTLSLDEFAYIYEGNPEWTNDPFFKASLEPLVFEMINSPAYKAKVKKNPSTPKEKLALETALINLKKIFDAGISITLGTDAGAQPIRAMGFSEHMEMELMVKAGIPVLETIKIATENGAVLLKSEKENGTLQAGKKANFIVLEKNPVEDITNTRTIKEVWKNGIKVSNGPIKK